MSGNGMSKLLILLAATALLPLISCRNASGLPSGTLRLLDSLDIAVENHTANVHRKAEELKRSSIVSGARPGRERYEAYRNMRTLYQTFDLDSAIHYGRMACEEADRIGDRELMSQARMNLARLYISRGHLHDVLPVIQQALPDTVIPSVHDCYIRVLADIDEISGRSPVKHYREMIRLLGPDDEGWWYYMFMMLMATEQYAAADSVLQSARPTSNVSPREYAIFNSLGSEAHLALGDTLRAVDDLIRSSLYDLSIPVRDYRSLYRLSALLFKMGQTERAYIYINLAVRDAEASKVYANRLEINRLMPDILTAYHQQVRHEDKLQRIMISGIAFFTLVLFAALAFVMKQRNKLRRISLSERNLNSRLKSTNDELRLLNTRLQESNKVRDAYLLQYICLSSEFVHDIEQLKIGISNSFHSKGIDGVNSYLAKIDDRRETRRFHDNFDRTFLALYPDFVPTVNSLLRPEGRLSLNRDGSLTTELRVIALLYLGITDSESIARFLHKSVSTIYNCRVRIRNNALDGRSGFTERLRNCL